MLLVARDVYWCMKVFKVITDQSRSGIRCDNRRPVDYGLLINKWVSFFNLQMKTLMASRRTSSLDVASLFWTTALTDLKVELSEQAFGKHINNKHTAMMWVMARET